MSKFPPPSSVPSICGAPIASALKSLAFGRTVKCSKIGSASSLHAVALGRGCASGPMSATVVTPRTTVMRAGPASPSGGRRPVVSGITKVSRPQSPPVQLPIVAMVIGTLVVGPAGGSNVSVTVLFAATGSNPVAPSQGPSRSSTVRPGIVIGLTTEPTVEG
ncbi:MAG: hypothetical protein IT293_13835 [Deltaproteobacteria bacterium]|nr:hypothetical protein [Deltaproteobacteria bacterium]